MYQAAAGKAFVIQPGQPVEIGRLEKDEGKLRALYEAGFRDAKEALPKLRPFLS